MPMIPKNCLSKILLCAGVLVFCWVQSGSAANLEVLSIPSQDSDTIRMAGPDPGDLAAIVVDTNDYEVVQLAAGLFAGDVQRVTGRLPEVKPAPTGASQMIIAGTLHHSAWVDALAGAGKLQDLDKVQGRWEGTLWEMVTNPFPGVDRALVIVGSDRRGTAYGFMDLSEQIGVSPWYWWADVPVRHRDDLGFKVTSPHMDSPAVQYRGFFINDEDWGLNPWASKTYDPVFGNIGPKTYERVFELMLRLRLNYIWPAMHKCSTEFGAVPENAKLANRYGVVAGSSHCEPMLYNNVHWNEQKQGPWNYALNGEAIRHVWEDNAEARGDYEAVWTLGIRGIHDSPMEKPPRDLQGKLKLMSKVLADQRSLLARHVSNQWGPVAQCFVPYKEVLPIYDAGLKVPEGVTLVWADDNFGYIRRLSSPSERRRAGGAGVYWHLSYYGAPHSYTWINTTAPAFMWEELHKAWENDARTLWVINVGDIKPAEIGIDYFSRLAWNPDDFSLGGQRVFLQDFATRTFGTRPAGAIVDLLNQYYRLGTFRKPELMDREWALSLPGDQASQLEADYRSLMQKEEAIRTMLASGERDAYTEMIGFPARVLADAGLIFMADRRIQLGLADQGGGDVIASLRADLDAQVNDFNLKIAGGKWNRIMPGLATGKELGAWSSQVRWPWGEKAGANLPGGNTSITPPAGQAWRDAATGIARHSREDGRWCVVEGLGPSGRAVALEPASLAASWNERDGSAPALEFPFTCTKNSGWAYLDFLPTFRICPGMRLRVSVTVDSSHPMVVEVPGSSGAENETGRIRFEGVQNNYVRAKVALADLPPGGHVFEIHAMDPGVVLDRVSLP